MSLASPDDIVTALRDYRCDVVEWPGWRTNGRPYSFDPYGQAWHHDAFGESYGDEAATRFIADTGRSDLPAPLANGTIGNFGTVYLTAYGNANHAGKNIASVHDRMRRGLAPLGDARNITESDTVVGNSRLWGWECRNAGTGHDPWDQLDVMVRAGAALCDACGWSPNANAGHKELTRRKIDPAGFDMRAFRDAIALTLYAQHHQEDEPLKLDDEDREWFRDLATEIAGERTHVKMFGEDGYRRASWRWAGESVTILRDLKATEIADAVVTRLGKSADAAVIKQAVIDGLTETLGSLDN